MYYLMARLDFSNATACNMHHISGKKNMKQDAILEVKQTNTITVLILEQHTFVLCVTGNILMIKKS